MLRSNHQFLLMIHRLACVPSQQLHHEHPPLDSSNSTTRLQPSGWPHAFSPAASPQFGCQHILPNVPYSLNGAAPAHSPYGNNMSTQCWQSSGGVCSPSKALPPPPSLHQYACILSQQLHHKHQACDWDSSTPCWRSSGGRTSPPTEAAQSHPCPPSSRTPRGSGCPCCRTWQPPPPH